MMQATPSFTSNQAVSAARVAQQKLATVLLEIARATPEQRAAALRTLRPSAAELALTFHAVAADALIHAYAAEPLELDVPGAARASVQLASPASLVSPPAGFDPAYARVAPFLRAGPVWGAWTYFDAQDRPLARFDGLVLRAGRWCWCPRPWRFLPAVAPAGVFDNWAD